MSELKCGCTLPVLSAACMEDSRYPKMPVADGLLDGKRVKVLRDSGCSCVVVRRGLIEDKDNDAKKVTVVLADGRAIQTKSAHANLECPYFVGNVDVVEMESPLYDVILGNIAHNDFAT